MQSRTASLVEQVTNVTLGFIIGVLLLQYLINPWFGMGLVVIQSLQATTMVFVFSVLRGFILRRIFVSGEPQSFLGSVMEKFLDTFVGFLCITVFWSMVIAPSLGIDNSMVQSVSINGIFLVANFFRGLLVRRMFETVTRRLDSNRVLV